MDKIYSYKLPGGKIIDIEAETEARANQLLLDFILDEMYVEALGEKKDANKV